MILKVYGTQAVQVIHLQPQFFFDYQENVRGKKIITTPKDKALQIGKQIFNQHYRGHILEKNGDIIQNTLEGNKILATSDKPHNKVNKSPREKSTTSSHLTQKLGNALKLGPQLQ